jgi:hypothetical protein
MAITTATCHPDPQRFPPGTVVGAYKATAWSGRDFTAAPTGAADTSATVAADGSLSFTGLTDQTSYIGYAGGATVRFSTRHDRVDDTVTSGGDNTLTGTNLFTRGATFGSTTADARIPMKSSIGINPGRPARRTTSRTCSRASSTGPGLSRPATTRTSRGAPTSSRCSATATTAWTTATAA